MFVLQHDNVVIRPRRIHRTPQRFNSTEEILPYNNVCNFKIKHTNSKFCRLCIIYKIPELIKDNYLPKIVLEKMDTHSYVCLSVCLNSYGRSAIWRVSKFVIRLIDGDGSARDEKDSINHDMTLGSTMRKGPRPNRMAATNPKH